MAASIRRGLYAGKTAVGIGATLARPGEYPVLITVPAHLVPQWRFQLELWGVPPEEIATAPRGCGPQRRIEALTSTTASYAIVSYNSWSNWDYLAYLLAPYWRAFIFDESHRLRSGRRSRRKGSTSIWEGVQYLRRKSKTKHLHTPVWMLSGTPLVRNAGDVWPLLFLSNPYRYGSRDKFIDTNCYTWQGDYGKKIGGVRDEEAFYALLGRHSIRRRWRDLPSLASLSRRDVEIPIELDQVTLNRHRVIKRERYDPLTGDHLESSAAMIHALRRLSVSAKVDTASEWLEDHPGRVLLLAHYRDTVSALASGLAKRRPVAVIDGGTSEKARHAAILKYRTTQNCVLIATLGTMQEGWDSLQVGYQVVFAEQSWLGAENEQAVARILRRGQSRPVLVTWLYAPRTFDMRVRRVASKRQESIDKALGEFLEAEEWTTR